jgi:hypothetical protein
LLIALALAGCAQPSNDEVVAAAASSSAPVPKEAISRGAALVADGKRLLILDGGLLVAPLPLADDVAFERHELPGVPGQVALTSRHVLVTVTTPSMLLVLGRNDLSEAARVPLPPGAAGVSVTSEGGALVTSAEAAKLSLVDVDKRVVRWSITVPPSPRQVMLSPTGDRVFITHRLSDGPTVVVRKGKIWTAEPGTGRARVDGFGVSTSQDVVMIHGARDGDQMRPELMTSSSKGWNSEALPMGSFVRSATYRASSDTLLVATDDTLVELSPTDGKLRSRASHRCRSVRGIAVAGDDTAYVACSDETLATVSLPLDDRVPVSYRSLASPEASRCEGVNVADGKISKAFAGMSYLSADAVERTLLRYHCRYPARTRLFDIATTHEKRKVWALAIGRAPSDHDRATVSRMWCSWSCPS